MSCKCAGHCKQPRMGFRDSRFDRLGDIFTDTTSPDYFTQPSAAGLDTLPLFDTAPPNTILAASAGVPSAPASSSQGSIFSPSSATANNWTLWLTAGIAGLLLVELLIPPSGGRRR